MFYKGTSFPVGKVDFMDLYAFKIYMLDVGLLLAMADLDASVIIDGNRIFTEFKGALTEQYVLQQMIAELGVQLDIHSIILRQSVQRVKLISCCRHPDRSFR